MFNSRGHSLSSHMLTFPLDTMAIPIATCGLAFLDYLSYLDSFDSAYNPLSLLLDWLSRMGIRLSR